MSIRETIALIAAGTFLNAVLCTAQNGVEHQAQIEQHSRKAQEYLSAKQPNLAIPELESVVALDPENVNAQANLGVLLFFQGKSADAIPHLRSALAQKSSLPKIRGLLGLAEKHTLDLTDARIDMEAAFPEIEDPRFQVQLGLELIGSYTDTGDLEKAAPIIAQMRKAQPDNPEVLYAAYRTYSDLAGESMLSLSVAAPDSAQMHQLLAHELLKEGNTNGAITQYRKAMAVNPDLPGVHFELAELFNTSSDAQVKKDAEQEYLAALKANPADEKAQCRIGDIDAARGDTAGAFKAYSKASELQPSDADAKLGLAKALIDMNQLDKAQALLEQAVQLEPTDPTAHYRLAAVYRKEKRVEDAKREVGLYKQYRDLKEKLRVTYKELLIPPNEIRNNEPDAK
jgi:cytochrome c-type biogenesis protein CcmH/NrfG